MSTLPPGFVEDDIPPPPGFTADGAGDPLLAVGLKQRGPTLEALAEKNAAGMGFANKATYGAQRALDEMAMGVKQIFPKALGGGLSSEDEQGLALRRKTEEKIPHNWASRMAGDVAMALPLSRGIEAGASLVRAAPKVMPYLAAAGTGAAYSALQPTLGPESRSDNAMGGALFGVGGKVGGDVAGRMIEGLVKKNPSVGVLPQAIRDKLTLGQAADRHTLSGNVAASTEEKLQSIPFFGNMFRDARAKATDSWREDLTQRVAPKGHVATGENTWEKINDISGAYRSKYGQALANHQVPPSQLFESQVAKITNNPRSGLTAQQQQEVRDMTMRYYSSMFHGNSPATGPAGTSVVTQGGARGTPVSIDAGNAKDFEAFLTKMASQYKRSNSPGSDNMAAMFDDLERAWSVSYRRALPSSARKDIKELDQSYAPFKTVERAASYTGNDFGNFTPQQLVQAVRARTPQSRYSRGGGILQGEAGAARDTMIDRIPNSGTTDRALTAGAIGGAILDPTTAALTLGAAVPAMLTKTGRNAMTGDTRMQEIMRQLRMNEALRNSGTLSGIVTNDLLDNKFTE